MPQPEYLMVETPQGLHEACAILSRAKIIALDMEADTLFHYGETACLAQLSDGAQIWLVDLRRMTDISPLKPILENAAVEKVLHGADYDIRLLRRYFGINCRPIFDTEVAARFLGMRLSSLAEVLGKRFGVVLDKKFQKSDWTQRPLSVEMCSYAASDVHWLIQLSGLMKEDLVNLGRLAWVEEECDILACLPDRIRKPGPLFLSFKGADLLDRRSLAILESLLQARELLAEQRDRPPFKVFSSDTIREIIRERPETDQGLLQIAGLGRRSGTFRAVVLTAVKDALNLSDERLPEYPRGVRRKPSRVHHFQERVQGLKEWRDSRSAILGLDGSLVCANSLIQELAVKRPVTPEELDRVERLRKWQNREFGAEICNVLSRL
ncbi:MAG: HRDC domain-containing protein [Candidatus Omnitrophica bacterium]|nr:HRDC domain-containing protein [Candidatus Omnitrophota bacterium]